MTTYIIEIQEAKNGELFIEFPDDLVDTLGWQEDDILYWRLKGDGVILSKYTDSPGTEVIEDSSLY
jgi:hypothetical protein